MRPALAFLAASLLLAAALPTMASPPVSTHSPCRPGIAFENDQVRIWFHGMKAFFQVFDNASGEAHYETQTLALAQLRDGQEVARMNLERAFPQTSTCWVEDDGANVTMGITITDTVRDAQGGPVGDATVSYLYRFDRASDGAKFDLVVQQWPWQGDGVLAFDVSLRTDNLSMDSASNGVGFRRANDDTFGSFQWASNATASYRDGSRQESTVTSETMKDGAAATVRLTFGNVTAGYERLDLDPWMGVGDYVIVGDMLVGLAPIEGALPLGVGDALRPLL
jgi:hypothetical protein